MNLIDRMFGHDRGTTAHYLELCKPLADEQWDQAFDVGHRTLRRTFDHMNESTDFWTGCMTGDPNLWREGQKSLNQLVADHDAVYGRFEAFARSAINEGRLDGTYEDVWQVRRNFGTTIYHVVLHNQTHRTEILHILERLGVENLPEGDPFEWEWRKRQQD